jgi:hypothetical protein
MDPPPKWEAISRPVAPPSPSLPPTPVPIPGPGIEPRFRALVKQIKGSPAYNEAIGAALGIEGSQQTGPDLTTVQPDIDAIISGTHVDIPWGWGGYAAFLDICEIEVDRSDTKGFVMLTFDTTPNYTDTTPFPSTPMKWTYRAIYRVGQWSKPGRRDGRRVAL